MHAGRHLPKNVHFSQVALMQRFIPQIDGGGVLG